MKTCQAILMMACATACACFGAETGKKDAPGKPVPDLGRVMFIGDSITHGVATGSYRWALHKIWVDNGIAFEVVGVETGNYGHGVDVGAMYIGKEFNNKHAAMSSQRAYETSGRNHTSGRLDRTDILDWLGLDKTYTGPRKIEGKAPDTYFILLGTNDTLSDHKGKGGIGNGTNLDEAQKALLDKKKGDLTVIVDAIRRANGKARIVVLSVPTWGNIAPGNNDRAEDYAAIVRNYNKKLAAWAKSKKVILADVNQGLIDVANTEKLGKGVASFFNKGDGLHPTSHGDLLMAGRVAQALGMAGRSGGVMRKASAKFDMSAAGMYEAAADKDGVELKDDALIIAPGKEFKVNWEENSDLSKGFAVNLKAVVGNGAAGGWDTEKGLVLSIGNGEHSGQLTITESYLVWNGSDVIFSADMSKNTQALRVSWLPGSTSSHVPGGFYVWVGDMLVGEALADDSAATKGLSLRNTTDTTIKVEHPAMDGTASAPAPKGYVKKETLAE